MSISESRRVLRRLELEAYACVVTALRAQGQLTLEKKSVLTQLSQQLSISTDRHHAEVRRAICDDDLCYIADCVSGTESRNSWLPEARRLGRGNPKLVARHSLSASTQAQALTALSLSGLKGGTGATNTKGDHVESTTEKKLPPQVQSALKMVLAHHPSAVSGTVTSVKTKASSMSTPSPAPPQTVSTPQGTSIGCQTDPIEQAQPPPRESVTTSTVGTQVDIPPPPVEDNLVINQSNEEIIEEKNTKEKAPEVETEPMEEDIHVSEDVMEVQQQHEDDSPAVGTATSDDISLPLKRPLEDDTSENMPPSKIPARSEVDHEVTTDSDNNAHEDKDSTPSPSITSKPLSPPPSVQEDPSTTNDDVSPPSTDLPPPPLPTTTTPITVSSTTAVIDSTAAAVTTAPTTAATDPITTIPPLITTDITSSSSTIDTTSPPSTLPIIPLIAQPTINALPTTIIAPPPVSPGTADDYVPPETSSYSMSHDVLKATTPIDVSPVNDPPISSVPPDTAPPVKPANTSDSTNTCTTTTTTTVSPKPSIPVTVIPPSISIPTPATLAIPSIVACCHPNNTLTTSTSQPLFVESSSNLKPNTVTVPSMNTITPTLPSTTGTEVLPQSGTSITSLLSSSFISVPAIDSHNVLPPSIDSSSDKLGSHTPVPVLSEVETRHSQSHSLSIAATAMSTVSTHSVVEPMAMENVPVSLSLPTNSVISTSSTPDLFDLLKSSSSAAHVSVSLPLSSIPLFSTPYEFKTSPLVSAPPLPTLPSLYGIVGSQSLPVSRPSSITVPAPSVQSIFSFPNPLVSNTVKESLSESSSLAGTPIDETDLLATVTSELGVESIDPSLLNMTDLLNFLPSDDMKLEDLAVTGGEISTDMVVLQEGIGGGDQTPQLEFGLPVQGNAGDTFGLGAATTDSLVLEDVPLEIKDTVEAILKSQSNLDNQ